MVIPHGLLEKLCRGLDEDSFDILDSMRALEGLRCGWLDVEDVSRIRGRSRRSLVSKSDEPLDGGFRMHLKNFCILRAAVKEVRILMKAFLGLMRIFLGS